MSYTPPAVLQATFVSVSGDAMSGPLHVQDPVDPTEAVNLQSMQAALADVGSGGGGVSTGTIVMFGSDVAPAEWQLCDGSPAGTPELVAVVGVNVPDLRDRFIVGAGSAYASGDLGGADLVTLGAAQSGLPAHEHTATAAAETTDHTHTTNAASVNSGTVSAWHAHSATTASGGPTHTHDDSVQEGITTGDSNDWVDSADDDTSTSANLTNIVRPANTAIGHTHTLTTGNPTANHVHAVDSAATVSGGRSAAHTHALTVANAGAQDAALPHENRPPYFALTYIIKQ